MKIKKIELRSAAKTACDCSGKPAAASSSCCPAPTAPQDRPSCCGPSATTRGGVISEEVPGFQCWLSTPVGRVAQIGSALTLSDHLGACKARWGIGRMSYLVPPGLYAIGTPDADSPVLVTANYKMTYDLLRHTLRGRNLWLLVLETFGVNVWCAAGKGTFGTEELVVQIATTRLGEIVSHRQLILPILGAPGVAAHEVTKAIGFHVRYGTIRAADLPDYLDNGQVTTPAMRELTFTTYDRLVLIPVEIVHALPTALCITLTLFFVAYFAGGRNAAGMTTLAYLGATFCGIVLGPLLLPWLPGRSFALKGASIGLLWVILLTQVIFSDGQFLQTLAATLALPAISAFYTLNFTGCSTYTSPNGVKQEMRRAMPLMGLALIGSAALLLFGFWL